jgi:hypothetical protein
MRLVGYIARMETMWKAYVLVVNQGRDHLGDLGIDSSSLIGFYSPVLDLRLLFFGSLDY